MGSANCMIQKYLILLSKSFSDSNYTIDAEKVFLYAYKAFALSYWKANDLIHKLNSINLVSDKFSKITNIFRQIVHNYYNTDPIESFEKKK